MKPEYKIGDKIKISNSKISKRFNKKTGTIIKINDDDYMAKIKLDTLVKTNVKIYKNIKKNVSQQKIHNPFYATTFPIY